MFNISANSYQNSLNRSRNTEQTKTSYRRTARQKDRCIKIVFRNSSPNFKYLFGYWATSTTILKRRIFVMMYYNYRGMMLEHIGLESGKVLDIKKYVM